MPRLLITGATGFIGRHCVAALADRDWEIHAASSDEPTGDPSDLPRWHRCDLLDPDGPKQLIAASKPAALLHLAWDLAPHSVTNYRWTRASIDLLMRFAQAGGKRAVFAGSCAEYDWQAGQPLTESSPRRPATPYGVSKDALFRIFESYRREVGLSGAWGRIFFLYGPGEGENRLIASTIRSLLTGREARSTHGKQVRDYLHVEDLADALVSLLGSDVDGAINLASGRPVELRHLTRTIARQLGREDLLRLGALAARDDEAPVVIADVSRLETELGWAPRIDPEDGLARTIDWWRRMVVS